MISSFPCKIKALFIRDGLKNVSVTWNYGSRPSWQLVAHQILKLVEEGFLILEIPIDRGKPHISDLVQLLQVLDQEFPYICSRYFAVGRIADFGFYPVDQIRELDHAHRPFFAGFQKAVQ